MQTENTSEAQRTGSTKYPEHFELAKMGALTGVDTTGEDGPDMDRSSASFG
jgi:hypothetical protein